MNVPFSKATYSLLEIAVLTMVALSIAGCASAQDASSEDTPDYEVLNSSFTCKSKDKIDLELLIVQDKDRDAISIKCTNDSDCTNPEEDTSQGRKVEIEGNDRIRWTLQNLSDDSPFYVIFDKDKSPVHAKNGRGANMVASSKREKQPNEAEPREEVCLKARSDPAKGAYRYSVYVKHCTTGDTNCRPRVLDPIIYVR